MFVHTPVWRLDVRCFGEKISWPCLWIQDQRSDLKVIFVSLSSKISFQLMSKPKANNLRSRLFKTDTSKTCLRSVTISGKNQIFWWWNYAHLTFFAIILRLTHFHSIITTYIFLAGGARRSQQVGCIYDNACKKTAKRLRDQFLFPELRAEA